MKFELGTMHLFWILLFLHWLKLFWIAWQNKFKGGTDFFFPKVHKAQIFPVWSKIRGTFFTYCIFLYKYLIDFLYYFWLFNLLCSLKPSRSVNLNQPEAHYLNSIHPETSMLQLMNLAVTEDSARVPDIMVFYTVCKCKL